MRRVSVVGNSGSGKTRLARQLASTLGAPHVELDAIFHQPGWQELPLEEFRARVAAAVVGQAWIVDGNYNSVRDIVWKTADTVVWIDPPRPVVTARVVRRTLRRVLTRQELWNGNREPWSNMFSFDPSRSIIAWSWTSARKFRDRYGSASVDPQWSYLRFIRLRNRRDRRRLLAEARAQPAVPPTVAAPGTR